MSVDWINLLSINYVIEMLQVDELIYADFTAVREKLRTAAQAAHATVVKIFYFCAAIYVLRLGMQVMISGQVNLSLIFKRVLVVLLAHYFILDYRSLINPSPSLNGIWSLSEDIVSQSLQLASNLLPLAVDSIWFTPQAILNSPFVLNDIADGLLARVSLDFSFSELNLWLGFFILKLLIQVMFWLLITTVMAVVLIFDFMRLLGIFFLPMLLIPYLNALAQSFMASYAIFLIYLLTYAVAISLATNGVNNLLIEINQVSLTAESKYSVDEFIEVCLTVAWYSWVAILLPKHFISIFSRVFSSLFAFSLRSRIA